MRSELNEVKQKKWTANPWNLKDISFLDYKIDYFLLPQPWSQVIIIIWN